MFTYDEIDEEILDIVIKFNNAGFETVYSCQGHIRFDEEDNTEELYTPYLMIELPDNESDLLYLLSLMTPMMKIEIHEAIENSDFNEDDYIDIYAYREKHTKNSHKRLSLYPADFIFPEDNRSQYFEKYRRIFLEDLNMIADKLLEKKRI